MAIAFRKAREELGVELRGRARIDRVEPVLLVDRLAQHQAPAALALFQEIVEPPGAHHVAGHALDRPAL